MSKTFTDWEEGLYLAHYGIPGMRKGVRKSKIHYAYLTDASARKDVMRNGGTAPAVYDGNVVGTYEKDKQFAAEHPVKKFSGKPQSSVNEELEKMSKNVTKDPHHLFENRKRKYGMK